MLFLLKLDFRTDFLEGNEQTASRQKRQTGNAGFEIEKRELSPSLRPGNPRPMPLSFDIIREREREQEGQARRRHSSSSRLYDELSAFHFQKNNEGRVCIIRYDVRLDYITPQHDFFYPIQREGNTKNRSVWLCASCRADLSISRLRKRSTCGLTQRTTR